MARGMVAQNIVECMAAADRLAVGVVTKNEYREKAAAKDEKSIQRQVANYLRLQGIWHDQDGMHRRRTGTIGAPDFQFPFAGAYVAWEVKCPWSVKLRPEQERAREAIEAQGGVWRLITGIEDAQGHLRELEGKNGR